MILGKILTRAKFLRPQFFLKQNIKVFKIPIQKNAKWHLTFKIWPKLQNQYGRWEKQNLNTPWVLYQLSVMVFWTLGMPVVNKFLPNIFLQKLSDFSGTNLFYSVKTTKTRQWKNLAIFEKISKVFEQKFAENRL